MAQQQDEWLCDYETKVNNRQRDKFIIGNKDEVGAVEYERLTKGTSNMFHFRINGHEHLEEFGLIMLKEFGIDINKVKVYYEQGKPIGCDWRELPKFDWCKTIWPHYKIFCLTDADMDRLGEVCNINVKKTEKSYWFPKRPILGEPNRYWTHKKKQMVGRKKPYDPLFPIYIISKGRFEKQVTRTFIAEMKVPYHMVVETDEIEDYVKGGCPREHILEFSPKDKKKWTEGKKNRFDSKNTKDGGSIPVRNFIWAHSVKNKHPKHWCIDDNIDGFYIFNTNERLGCKVGQIFRCIEDYADRYENLWMCGMNYLSFMPEISKNRELIQKNTRVYSVILLDNRIPELFKDEQNPQGYMWRGTYNEDTDLSLRLLKKGQPTALFNMFLANKMTTKSCKGGNTDSIYKEDGLQKKLESLLAQHPDVTKQTSKYKKDNHHQVDYRGFADNELIMKEGVSEGLTHNPFDYEMKIILDETKSARTPKQKSYIPKKVNLKVVEKIEKKIEEPPLKNFIIPSKIKQAEDFIKGLDMSDEELKQLMISIVKDF